MGLFDFGKKNKYFRIAEEAFEAGDYGRSFEYYTLASDLGHLQAKRNLAYQYRFGFGVEEDHETAYRLYREHFERSGDESILSLILDMYLTGDLEGIAELTDDECFDYAYRGAHAGGIRAYGVLGYYYLEGVCCEVNSYLGARWTYEAYLNDDVDATFTLGRMFDEDGAFFPYVPAYSKYFLETARSLCDEKGIDYPDGLCDLLGQERFAKIQSVKPDESYFNRNYLFDSPLINFEGRRSPDESMRLASMHTLGVDEDGNRIDTDPNEAEKYYYEAINHFFYSAEYCYAMFCYPCGNDSPVVDENGELVHLSDSPNAYVSYLEKASAKGDLDAMMELVSASLDEDGGFYDKARAEKYIALISCLHGVDYHKAHTKEMLGEKLAEKKADEEKKSLPLRDVHEITATYEYKGSMIGDQRVKGTLIDYVEGWTYEGEFVNNTICGMGKFTYPNGDTDEGYMKDGRLHGYGVRTSKGNHVTYGDFQEGKRHGICFMEQSNGEFAAGFFGDGHPDGLMLYHHKDGMTEAGIFNERWENTSLQAIEKRFGGDVPTCELDDGGVYHGATDEETCNVHGWGWSVDRRTGSFHVGRFDQSVLKEGVFMRRIDREGEEFYIVIMANEFDDYRPCGNGVVMGVSPVRKTVFAYVGEFCGGEYNGEGTYRSENGTVISGEFVNSTVASAKQGKMPNGEPMDEGELAKASLLISILSLA